MVYWPWKPNQPVNLWTMPTWAGLGVFSGSVLRAVFVLKAKPSGVKLKRHDWLMKWKRLRGFTVRVLFNQTNKQKMLAWIVKPRGRFHPWMMATLLTILELIWCCAIHSISRGLIWQGGCHSKPFSLQKNKLYNSCCCHCNHRVFELISFSIHMNR